MTALVGLGFLAGTLLGSHLVTEGPPAQGTPLGGPLAIWTAPTAMLGLAVGFALKRRRRGPMQPRLIAAGFALALAGLAAIAFGPPSTPLPFLGLLLTPVGVALALRSGRHDRKAA